MGIEKYVNKRVMVVDDLPNMRTDLVKILESLGFKNIKEMKDGKVAWEELRSEALYGNPYEIVFSDINMPLMSGVELLKAMRSTETYKYIPIFIVSTVNEKNTVIQAVLEGATDYILKPYTPAVVIEKITTKLR